MEYRYLGQSGLKVSTLTLGTATFGAVGELAKWGSTEAKQARRLLDLCVEAGINLVDTANFYSQGRSEEMLGEVLSGLRQQVLIASKVRFAMGSGPNDEGLSRHHIIAQCEASLRRLRIECIDLYQMHEWDGMTPLEETLEAFDSLVRTGKVRYTGVSNFAGWQLMKTMGVAGANRYIKPIAQQVYYSLETRDVEYELIPASIDQKIGILVWSPLAGGLLSGKYRRGKTPSEGGRHLNDWHVPPIENKDRLYDKIELLVQIAEGYGVSAAEVALAWLLTRPAVSSVIIGARTEQQLSTNLGCVHLKLSQEDIDKLEAISRPRLLYPYWHQRLMSSSRLGPADLSLLGPHLQP